MFCTRSSLWGYVKSPFALRHETMRSTKHFQSYFEKGFRRGCVLKLIRNVNIVTHIEPQESPLSRDGSLEVLGNVRLALIVSIWIVSLLIVEVHFHVGHNRLRNVVYMTNEKNCSILLHFFVSCLFFDSYMRYFSVFHGLEFFITKRFVHLLLQIEKCLSETNVTFQIRSKAKLCAVQFFSEWASRINFLIMGQQNIFSYWYFLSNLFTNCKIKCSILKRHVERGMFVENLFKQPTGWIGGIWRNGSPLVFATTHLFSQGLPSLCFEAVLEFVNSPSIMQFPAQQVAKTQHQKVCCCIYMFR